MTTSNSSNSENINSKTINFNLEEIDDLNELEEEVNISEFASSFSGISQFTPQPNIVPTVKKMVEDACAAKASDIHIRVGLVPRFRIRGELIVTDGYKKTTREIFNNYLAEILTLAQRKRLAQTRELDVAILYPGLVRCRVNCFDSLNGGAIVLRLISLEIPSIEQLNLPQILKQIVTQPDGLILVTGATGTGKSTTIASMINYLNQNCNKHIVTIEDPISFVHSSDQCLITQREVGLHTHHFHEALRSALREDPDIIVISELRDKISVETVLRAAQTGHLVLSTLHTRSAIDVVNSLVSLYHPDEHYSIKIQLLECLVAVISQSLARTVYNSLIPVNEILINTPTMKDYLLHNNKEEALQLMEDDLDGMQVMNQSIYEALLKGTININEGLNISSDPEELERRIRTRGIEGHSSAREWMEY